MKRVGVNILIVILILVGSLLPFNINNLKAEPVSGDSPIIGVNIKVINYDYERVYDAFYPINYISEQSTEKSIWRCTNFNSTSNACLQWANDYSSGTIPGAEKLTFVYNANLFTIIDTQYAKYTYEYEFVLDDYYVGSITFQTNYTYDHESPTTHKYRTYYVNGTSFTVSGTAYTNSWVVQSYDLTRKVDNKTWNFPIESFSFANYMFNNEFNQVGIVEHNDYMFPIFETSTGDKIYSIYKSSSAIWTFKVRLRINKPISSLNQFNNYFEYPDYVEIQNLRSFNSGTSSSAATNTTSECFLYFDYVVNSASSDIYLKVKQDCQIMPVFFQRDNYKFISTDFALNFDLKNELLDNLELIANGNTTSNNSISNADQINEDNQAIFSQEEQFVSNQESDMANKLNDLDISNKNNSLFGDSKFIASANWVKTQFNYLTNNNAFNYMITFSLVIGISLVIIGKLRG